jgi:signal transduction histidine kinase
VVSLAGVDGTVWQALAKPHRLILSAWPARALGYLLSGALLGFGLLLALLVTVLLGLVTLVVGIGFVLLMGVAFSGVLLGPVERRRLAIMRMAEPADPHVTVTAAGFREWLRIRRREAATWRELGYLLLMAGPLALLDLLVPGFLLSLVFSLLAAPFAVAVLDEQVDLGGYSIDTGAEAWPAAVAGIIALAVALVLITAYAGGRAALAKLLLGASEEETNRVLAVTRDSRARLVRAFDAERSRIERELHDGVQQQLVGLAATIGLARHEAGEAGSARLDQAAEQVRDALASLRETVHELDPPVLRERGLAGALERVARRSTLDVTVDAELPGRLEPAVERSVYFAVCELLGNAEKHAGAARVDIRLRVVADVLRAEVRDDGNGGATSDNGGTGLLGIADRLAVHDGRLDVVSPAGGPTTATIEVSIR